MRKGATTSFRYKVDEAVTITGEEMDVWQHLENPVTPKPQEGYIPPRHVRLHDPQHLQWQRAQLHKHPRVILLQPQQLNHSFHPLGHSLNAEETASVSNHTSLTEQQKASDHCKETRQGWSHCLGAGMTQHRGAALREGAGEGSYSTILTTKASLLSWGAAACPGLCSMRLSRVSSRRLRHESRTKVSRRLNWICFPFCCYRPKENKVSPIPTVSGV